MDRGKRKMTDHHHWIIVARLDLGSNDVSNGQLRARVYA